MKSSTKSCARPDEQVLSTSHPYINRLALVPLPQEELSMRLARLREAAVGRNGDAIRTLLFSAVSESVDNQSESVDNQMESSTAANSSAAETLNSSRTADSE